MKKIIAIVLFVFVAGLWVYVNYFMVPGSQEKEITPSVSPVAAKSITMSSQFPGSSITVARIGMDNRGYAVVYENNQGMLGKIIGNSKILPAGESVNVFIGLVRAVKSGESLFLVLHEDTGDGIFTPSIDLPAKDEEDNIRFLSFVIN